MGAAVLVIVLGIAGLVFSGVTSAQLIKRRLPGLPREMWDDTAGTGVVPPWVSLANLLSWGALVVGCILLVISLLR